MEEGKIQILETLIRFQGWVRDVEKLWKLVKRDTPPAS
jgi:hypothetical protein